jgi:DNA-binding MarR family transcriptional regulator
MALSPATPKAEIKFRSGAPKWTGLLVAAIANRCMLPKHAELESRFGLSSDEGKVIVFLGMSTAVTAQQISDYTGRAKNSILRAVSTLEVRGMLERSTHPEDARASYLKLTTAGLRLFEEIGPVFAAAEERILEALDKEERKSFLAMLLKIDAATSDWR